MDLSKKHHFHFMGISGIGMSGIAKILRQQGHTVSGCDTGIDHTIIQGLEDLGCTISSKHESILCADPTIDTIIYNSFIASNHPELQTARQRNITLLHRAGILALLMKQKISIGVAGSHGKTSTSALVSHILTQAQCDPTYVVGGILNSTQSNARYGLGQYLVAETDESDRSFLQLPKQYAIITNIDIEHLEAYRDFDDIKQTFLTFMNDIPTQGLNIVCIDDHGIQAILGQLTVPYITYGRSPLADIQARNIQLAIDHSTFDIFQKSTDTILGSIFLNQPGFHYVLNATGAIALALHLHIPFETIREALNTFDGVDRRFTFKGISKPHQAHVFDDYGHHPLAIDYALTIARKKAKNNLVVVFQPHRFSRTKHLWHDFIKTFSNNQIDTLIITDIYPAFEQPIESITSKRLVQELKTLCPHKQIIYCPIDQELHDIKLKLDQTLQKDDLLLLLGAGKVNKLASKLIA